LECAARRVHLRTPLIFTTKFPVNFGQAAQILNTVWGWNSPPVLKQKKFPVKFPVNCKEQAKPTLAN
jgi:hypothetical protein